MSPSANAKQKINVEYSAWAAECIADKTTDVLWVHGGLGCGKTFGAVQIHDNWVLENPKCKASWFIEPTHGKVEDTAIPAWYEWFEKLELLEGKDFRVYRSKPQKLVIQTSGGQHTVYFHSADRPQLMVGNKIGFFTLDEAGDSKYDVFERATTRRRDRTANYLQSLVIGAPQGLNWFSDKADFQGYDEERNEKSFELWTEDNAHNLAPGYIDSCLKAFGHNPAKVKSWLYGQFTPFHEGQAYIEYDPSVDRHNLRADPRVPLYMCWDFNVSPLAWVAGQRRYVETQDSSGHKLCSVGNSSGESQLIVDACVEFIARFDPEIFRATPIRVTGDATGAARSVRARGTNYDEIRDVLTEFYDDVKIITPRVNPAVDVRVEQVNKAFSYGLAAVHIDDEKLNQSLLRTAWKANTRQLAKGSGDDVTHWADAWGYWIYEEMHKQNLRKIPRRKIIY